MSDILDSKIWRLKLYSTGDRVVCLCAGSRVRIQPLPVALGFFHINDFVFFVIILFLKYFFLARFSFTIPTEHNAQIYVSGVTALNYLQWKVSIPCYSRVLSSRLPREETLNEVIQDSRQFFSSDLLIFWSIQL